MSKPPLEAVRRNIDAWTREMEDEGLNAILITASGCGTTIKDYGHMLRIEPAYAGQAARVSAIARDITSFNSGLRRDKFSFRFPAARLRERFMTLSIGSKAPDFTAETTQGDIRFHDWLGDSWAILFSHPKDFTPVCTTELGYLAKLVPEFTKRNCKVIGLSVDPVGSHDRWLADIKSATGGDVTYPIIGDKDLKVAQAYEMLPASAGESSEGRTAADNQTVRTVYLIGPDKLIKAMLSYPMSSGRNFDEVLRLLDSCQLTARHKVATPVNWKWGEDVIIVPSVSDDEAKERFPQGWNSVTPYMRVVPQPQD